MDRIYLILGALAVVGTMTAGAYLKGRSDGVIAEAARAFEKIQDLNEDLEEIEEQAQEREQARLKEVADLEEEIEDLRRQANEDPDADRTAIGTNSVLRINSVN